MTSAPYRVLHLIHSHHRRGAEVFAAQLASCSEERGLFKNAVCSLFNRGDDGLPLDGLPVFRLNETEGLSNKVGLDPRLVVRLLGVLRSFGPDVIVSHGGETLKYAAAAGCFYRKASTIYRNIGMTSIWANSTVKVNLNKLFLCKMDAVVSVSEYTRQDFMRVYRFSPARIKLIPNGVDPSQFGGLGADAARAEARQELGLPLQGTVITTVGNLSEEKGHDGLIRLMPDLVRQGIDGHLLLVGEGPLRQDLERRASSLGVGDRAHFLGRRQDVGRILAASDLFALPSKTEGMPAALIEAGLSGLASVAFDVGGVSEVVQHQVTGLLAPGEDFPEFSRALASLCRDRQLRWMMGLAAKRRCCGLFNMGRVAGQYEALYLDLLSSDRRRVNGRKSKWSNVNG